MITAPIDVCFLIIIFIFAISAAIKGFIKELFGKIAIIAGLAAAIIFTPKLDFYVSKSIKNPIFSKILSFLLIFILFSLLIAIIQQIFSKLFSGEIMKGLNKSLGFILGAAEGFIVVISIMTIISLQTWFDVSFAIEGSFFFRLFSDFTKIPSSYIKGITDV